jgi:hypothetical protein
MQCIALARACFANQSLASPRDCPLARFGSGTLHPNSKLERRLWPFVLFTRSGWAQKAT